MIRVPVGGGQYNKENNAGQQPLDIHIEHELQVATAE